MLNAERAAAEQVSRNLPEAPPRWKASSPANITEKESQTNLQIRAFTNRAIHKGSIDFSNLKRVASPSLRSIIQGKMSGQQACDTKLTPASSSFRGFELKVPMLCSVALWHSFSHVGIKRVSS